MLSDSEAWLSVGSNDFTPSDEEDEIGRSLQHMLKALSNKSTTRTGATDEKRSKASVRVAGVSKQGHVDCFLGAHSFRIVEIDM